MDAKVFISYKSIVVGIPLSLHLASSLTNNSSKRKKVENVCQMTPHIDIAVFS